MYITIIKVEGTCSNGCCVDRKAHSRLVMPNTQLAQVGRCLVEILSHNIIPLACTHFRVIIMHLKVLRSSASAFHM